MRVGALPVFPHNALKYNLTWSTDGLINEYCNPCESIRDGVLTEVPALEELEQFTLDGVEYEAFNTSGGLGTLCDTLNGKVENLNYKTARYPRPPRHRQAARARPASRHAPRHLQGRARDRDPDHLSGRGPGVRHRQRLARRMLTQESYAKKIYSQTVGDRLMSAIQITTAAGICAMCDMLVEGKLPQKGFVRQEDAALPDFLNNRFGRYYAKGH